MSEERIVTVSAPYYSFLFLGSLSLCLVAWSGRHGCASFRGIKRKVKETWSHQSWLCICKECKDLQRHLRLSISQQLPLVIYPVNHWIKTNSDRALIGRQDKGSRVVQGLSLIPVLALALFSSYRFFDNIFRNVITDTERKYLYPMNQYSDRGIILVPWFIHIYPSFSRALGKRYRTRTACWE